MRAPPERRNRQLGRSAAASKTDHLSELIINPESTISEALEQGTDGDAWIRLDRAAFDVISTLAERLRSKAA